MEKPDKNEFQAATDAFHAFNERFTYAYHQRAYDTALLQYKDTIFKRMKEEQWPLLGLRFDMVLEIVNNILVGAGEWGSSMYASLVRGPEIPPDADVQMPFDTMWDELEKLDGDEQSPARRVFDSEFDRLPLLSELHEYCVDYLKDILTQKYTELRRMPDVLEDLLDEYVWAGVKQEFLFTRFVPTLRGVLEKSEKLLELKYSQPSAQEGTDPIKPDEAGKTAATTPKSPSKVKKAGKKKPRS